MKNYEGEGRIQRALSQISLDRRDFLKISLATAGATVLSSSIFPSYALGQSGKVTAVMPGVFIPDEGRPIVERLSGYKLENAPYQSPTDTVAKLLAPGGTGRYDLMISNTEFVKGPILGEKPGDEKVKALDMDKIPNAAKVMPLWKNEPLTRGNKTYMFPIVWGYDSVIYNKDRIPEGDSLTQSWGILFDDKYKGRVALRDDAHQSILATGLYLGHSDPASMDKSDLKEVTKFLISKKKNFRTLWAQFGEAVSMMASGEVWAMYGWIAMRAALQRQGQNVTNNWPKEGLIIWNQGGFIPKDSENADGAHKIINAMLSKEFGLLLTKKTNYPSVSVEVKDAFSPEEQRKYGFDLMERGLNVYRLKWPKLMDQWIEAWGNFKTA
jgi:spermidine/putrescine-binding protein